MQLLEQWVQKYGYRDFKNVAKNNRSKKSKRNRDKSEAKKPVSSTAATLNIVNFLVAKMYNDGRVDETKKLAQLLGEIEEAKKSDESEKEWRRETGREEKEKREKTEEEKEDTEAKVEIFLLCAFFLAIFSNRSRFEDQRVFSEGNCRSTHANRLRIPLRCSRRGTLRLEVDER